MFLLLPEGDVYVFAPDGDEIWLWLVQVGHSQVVLGLAGRHLSVVVLLLLFFLQCQI